MNLITHDRLLERIKYDPLTGAFTWLTHQKSTEIGKEAGCIDNCGYRKIAVDRHPYMGHRLAWFYVHKEWPEVIDHINGVRNDNRLCNLRNTDMRGNMQNWAMHRDGKGQPGVSKRLKGGRYHAHIFVNGVTHHLGAFDTEEEACEAYRIACADPSSIQKYIPSKVKNGLPIGVNLNKKTGNYNVEIKVNGERFRKGGIKSLEEAIALLEQVKEKA